MLINMKPWKSWLMLASFSTPAYQLMPLSRSPRRDIRWRRSAGRSWEEEYLLEFGWEDQYLLAVISLYTSHLISPPDIKRLDICWG